MMLTCVILNGGPSAFLTCIRVPFSALSIFDCFSFNHTHCTACTIYVSYSHSIQFSSRFLHWLGAAAVAVIVVVFISLHFLGLDKAMYKYVNAFTNNEVKGQMLLNIRPYELVELGMKVLGHQEIVLGAVEQLQNFNYGFEKENLQYLAMRVATTAKNLHHQLADHTDKSKVETQILYDITRAIATIKPLVAWLDRSPFQGN